MVLRKRLSTPNRSNALTNDFFPPSNEILMSNLIELALIDVLSGTEFLEYIVSTTNPPVWWKSYLQSTFSPNAD